MQINDKPDPIQIRKARAFHDKLVKYLREYEDYLLHVKSDGTLVSHRDIIHEFINYMYSELVTDFDQITVPIVTSKYYAYYKRENKLEISKDEMKHILKGFFTFLYGKYGLINEEVMKELTIKEA